VPGLFYSGVQSGHGGTGRRKGLKIPRSNPSGFESRCPHQHFYRSNNSLSVNRSKLAVIAIG
jgi:hypothetical protein